MKNGVRIINCARGGLVVEADARRGARRAARSRAPRIDVFDERAGDRRTRCSAWRTSSRTPHLGASTTEAQENVALQVAEQMSDYLINGRGHQRPQHAVDHGRGSAAAEAVRQARRGARRLRRPADRRPDQGGRDRISTARSPTMNTRALTSAALAGLLRPQLADVNMVSAPVVAKERGISVAEVRRDQRGAYRRLHQADGDDRAAGRARSPARCFSDGKPRIIQIKGINMDAEFAPHMLYIDQRGQAGLHRPARHAARRRRRQHRQLPSRPPGAGRRRHRAASRSMDDVPESTLTRNRRLEVLRRSHRDWSRAGRASNLRVGTTYEPPTPGAMVAPRCVERV